MKLRLFENRKKYKSWLMRLLGISFVLLLLLGTFVLAMVQGGYATWFLFYALLPFELYGLLLFFYPLSDFVVHRDIVSTAHHVGGEIKVRLQFQRKWMFPIFSLKVSERVQNSNEKNLHDSEYTSNKVIGDYAHHTILPVGVLFPFLQRTFEVDYVIDDVVRGEYRLDNIRLHVRDFLSLVTTSRTFEIENTVIIYPNIHPLSLTVLKMIGQHSEEKETKYMTSQQATSIVSSIREYKPGDQERTIDWKSSAKRNQLMSKVFEDEKQARYAVVLNCFSDPICFEEMVSLTASIVSHVTGRGQEMALIIRKAQPTAMHCRVTNSRQWMLQLAHVAAETTTDNPVTTAHLPHSHAAIYVTDEATVTEINYATAMKSTAGIVQMIVFQKASHRTLALAKEKGIDITYMDSQRS